MLILVGFKNEVELGCDNYQLLFHFQLMLCWVGLCAVTTLNVFNNDLLILQVYGEDGGRHLPDRSGSYFTTGSLAETDAKVFSHLGTEIMFITILNSIYIGNFAKFLLDHCCRWLPWKENGLLVNSSYLRPKHCFRELLTTLTMKGSCKSECMVNTKGLFWICL